MDDRELLNLIGHELRDCAGGTENDFLESNRKAALAAYLGQPNGKEVEGRSKVTSTDVADTIEWIMPLVMEQLTRGICVQFDALSETDMLQAELESQYVYNVLMKKNPGFTILHAAVKDALMQKTGFTKTFFEHKERTITKRYTGLDSETLNTILGDDSTELLQLSESGDPENPTFDVKIRKDVNKNHIRVQSFPPEEFRINRQHNTCRPEDARFCAHVYLLTASELVEAGIPREIVDDIPTGIGEDHDRDYRFYYQNETVYPNRDNVHEPSQRIIEVAECYAWIDIDDDGVAEYVKIEVAGGDNPTHILSIEELECVKDNPITAFSAILMSHKFFGLSIFDRLKEIQDQKTTLWRNWFDNVYLQNNQRTAVLEGMVNLDDLLISRPGGIIRQKQLGAVEPIQTAPVGEDASRMMDYLDQVRASRAGVNPEGPLQVQDLGDRVGSQGVANLLAAREAVVDLIVRVLTETGMKELCYKIQRQASKHMSTFENLQVRGQWQKVRPVDWMERESSSVLVGTGSGGTAVDRMAIETITAAHSAIKQEPGQVLVGEEEQYRAWERFCTLSGMPLASRYFIDPMSPKGQQAIQQRAQAQGEAKQKEDAMQQSMLEMQGSLASAEVQKAKSDMANVTLKAQIEALKQELEEAKTAIDVSQKHDELGFKYDQLNAQTQLKLTELEVKERTEASKIHAQNKESGDANGSTSSGTSKRSTG